MISKYLAAAIALAVVAGPAASVANAAQTRPESASHSTMAKSDRGSCSEKLISHYPSSSTIQRELAVLRSNSDC